MTLTPEIKPQVVHLSEVVKWVESGKLRVPNFQRAYQWDRGRMCDLFDSIVKQYPIGTLLLWVAGPDQIKRSRSDLGPLSLPEAPPGAMLVLDGQQRVTTIAGVALRLRLASEPVDSSAEAADPDPWDIAYDVRDPEQPLFRHLLRAEAARAVLPEGCIRARDLFDPGSFFKALKDRAEAGATEAHQVAWQAASIAIQTYKVPVVEFHTTDLRLAVESFTRLNRRGLDITADEMFSALAESNSEGVRLATLITEIIDALYEGGHGRLDRTTVLRLVLFFVDVDPFATDWTRLSKDRQGNVRSKLLDAAMRARESLLAAADYLRDRARLPSFLLLPYSSQLLGLAVFLDAHPAPSPEEHELIAQWLWSTTFCPDDSNPSRVRRLLKSMKVGVDEQIVPHQAALPFPERFDLRSARVQALLWSQVSTCVDLAGAGFDIRRAAGFVQAHRSHAWRRVWSGGAPKSLLSSPANRVFDVWGLGEGLARRGPAAEDLRTLVETEKNELLTALAIEDEARSKLLCDDREGFLLARQWAMIEAERAFMEKRKVTPSTMNTPGPTQIDHTDNDETD